MGARPRIRKHIQELSRLETEDYSELKAPDRSQVEPLGELNLQTEELLQSEVVLDDTVILNDSCYYQNLKTKVASLSLLKRIGPLHFKPVKFPKLAEFGRSFHFRPVSPYLESSSINGLGKKAESSVDKLVTWFAEKLKQLDKRIFSKSKQKKVLQKKKKETLQ